jgi:hypothetical protein
MRLRPASGTQAVSAMAFMRAVSRSFVAASLSVWSMRMNHCGVLRKITGFLERQECG